MGGDNNNFGFLSKSECEEILHKATNGSDEKKIVSFEIVPVANEIFGFLGDYFHLNITAKDEVSPCIEQFNFFVKSAPIFKEDEDNYIERMQVFPKECTIYSEILKEMAKYQPSTWHPQCYYARKDILVMEDLAKLNYKHLAIDDHFSLDHMKLGLESLAALHAGSIIVEEKSGINFGKKYGEMFQDMITGSDNEWLNIGFRTIIAVASTLPKFQNNSAQKYIAEDYIKNQDKVINILKDSRGYRKVLGHRDLWVKNILFKYDAENPNQPVNSALIDYQICCYCLPAHDVLQFIYLNSDKRFRVSHLNYLLDFYYTCLSKQLKSAKITADAIMTRDEFIKSCNYAKLVAITIAAVYTQMIHLPEGCIQDLKKNNPEKFVQYVLVDRTDFVFDHMRTNKFYKKRITENIEEAVEYAMGMA